MADEHTQQPTAQTEPDVNTRCGVLAVVGRPNVGKSTLMNALIGEHLSITSSKPQTTRHRVLGVSTETIAKLPTQLVFVDTPGFQTRHSSALNRSMNRAVITALADVHAVLWVVDHHGLKRADTQVLQLIPDGVPVVVVVNKVDTLANKNQVLPFLQQVAALQTEARSFAAIVPVSAQGGTQLDVLKEAVANLLPMQPFFYDEDMLTDRPERFLAAERIREKLFRLVGDELPYTCTVVIDRFVVEEGRRVVHASIVVDKASHKAMIIGKHGEKLKRIGTEARLDMQQLFGGPVHLETWVKVRGGWADDATVLAGLGYE